MRTIRRRNHATDSQQLLSIIASNAVWQEQVAALLSVDTVWCRGGAVCGTWRMCDRENRKYSSRCGLLCEGEKSAARCPGGGDDGGVDVVVCAGIWCVYALSPVVARLGAPLRTFYRETLLTVICMASGWLIVGQHTWKQKGADILRW